MRDILRKAREDAGLTQTELARLARMDRSNYVHIELGDRNPSLGGATAIARVLGKPIEVLFPSGDVLAQRTASRAD